MFDFISCKYSVRLAISSFILVLFRSNDSFPIASWISEQHRCSPVPFNNVLSHLLQEHLNMETS